MIKRCWKCDGLNIKKNWMKRWKQMYKCKEYWYSFHLQKKEKEIQWIWKEYVHSKRTYEDLAWIHNKSERTIQRYIKKAQVIEKEHIWWKDIVIVMDATYFWRLFWIVVLRDYHNKRNIWCKEVSRENLEHYREWINWLTKSWYRVVGIVCDGRRWVLGWFWDIPMQMCIVHQKRIIRRYITSRPKQEANIELKDIVFVLGKIRSKTWLLMLDDWNKRYTDFLNEKSLSWKWYMYERTRKAYKSLRSNEKYLFTYEKYTNIPSTTNCLEWEFSHLKTHTRIHRGLVKDVRLKLCFEFLNR